jgi:DMSO/TMAO reductase YedYZ molybdopterin-dependent catalytic subunit
MRSRLRPFGLALLLVCACSGGDAGAGRVEVQVAGVARTWTQAELAAMPASTVEYHGKQYTGVPLAALVPAIGLPMDAPLTATAADGYTQTLAPEVLGRADALLAYAVDGEPLPAEDGPLRLVVPGAKGLSVKQLVRLGQP